MHYIDCQRLPELKAGRYDAKQLFWEGEPTAEMALITTGELFRQLERELASADVLRILDRNWLTGTEFKQQVETRVDEFRRRGGQVEYRGPDA